MFIHYDQTTNMVTGYTNFINPVPAVWDEPTIEIDTFDFISPVAEYQIQGGIPVHVGKTQEMLDEELLKATNAWKEDRQALVNAIEVTYNTVVYQGDETSQDRMSRTINALPDDVTTIDWTAKDNSVNALTRVDLKAILLDAGTQQAALWNVGRPV